jgi:5-methylcytosine-specific restriction protein A
VTFRHKRREFSAEVRRAAWERCKDAAGIPRCEECTAQLSSGNIHYDERQDGEFDHDLADALLGEPTLENCKVRCKACHLRKTGRDRKLIAKSNHARDRHIGAVVAPQQVIVGSRASGWKHHVAGGWSRR